MCGRTALTATPEDLREIFALDALPEPMPARYNIAPSQPIAVVRADAGQRLLVAVRWGMVPRRTPRTLVINTRAEVSTSRAAFREARRCLVPVDGFYEWGPSEDAPAGTSRRGRPRQAYFFRAKDRRTLALAGLWERPNDEGDLESCVVLTMPARAPVAALHDRMPVLVAPSLFAAWLDRSLPDFSALLRASADIALEAVPVGDYVNSAAHEGPACWDPPGPVAQRRLF